MLAAGKGVIIAKDEREARAAIDVFFGEKRFGETEVVLEEFLEGEELSLLALCDGERAVPMAPAQDYKRIFDGDEGPNTGGMGSYSPVPGIDAERAREIAGAGAPADRRRAAPPRHALPRRALRRADDERRTGRRCSSTTPASATPRRRRSCRGCARTCSSCSRRRPRPGGLDGVEPEWSSDWAVTVVLASRRLPGVVVEGRRDLGPRRSLDRRRGAPRGHGRARRRGRHRGRPGAERDRPGRDARRGARPRVRRGREDRVRRQADAGRDIAARAVDRVEA